VGDTIDPLGAVFKNPLVLLHQHDSDEPIGQANFGKPTVKGIPFTATIPQTDALPDSELKDRLDTAWGEIELGLVRAVSIGFRPLKYAYNENGGIEYQAIEVFELSTVSVPANAEAVITSIKSVDGAISRALVEKIKEYDHAPAKTFKRAIPLVSAPRPPKGAVSLKK
jgi:HK97 family phage prohead protease